MALRNREFDFLHDRSIGLFDNTADIAIQFANVQ